MGWLDGSLGKLLALIGFAMVFAAYIFQAGFGIGDGFYRTGLIGGTICVIAGGIVGISDTFFGLGTGLF